MADPTGMSSLPPIGVDPTDWYNLQRRQMQAQMLQQQAYTPLQENNFPGQRIRSRISGVNVLDQLGAALMAKKKMAALAPDQANMYQQSMVPFGGAPPAPRGAAPQPPPQDQGGVGPSPTPAAQATAPGAGAGGGAPSPAPSGPAPGVGAPPSGVPNMNPMGLPPALALKMFRDNPAQYGALVAGPDGWRTAVMAAGGNVGVAQRMVLSKMVKEGTLEARPGGMLMGQNPDGTKFTIRNPNLAQGQEPDYDAAGNVVGVHLLPGVAGATATEAGAQAFGKESGELHELPTQSGGTRPQIGVAGVPGAGAGGTLPPNLGGAPPGGPPQYFPPQTPMALPGGGPAGPAGAGGPHGSEPGSWWPNMPKVPVDNSLGDPSTFNHGKNELRAKVYGDQVKQLGLEADTADQKLEYSTELLRNLPNSFTGPNASGIASFWNTVNQIPGIRSLIPASVTQDAAGTQIAVKNLVNQAIQGARAIYGPRMAQSEVMLQKNEASPSATMGIQAIYALQRQEDAKSAYFIQRKKDFDRYDSEGGDPLRFEGSYQSRFPLSKFATQYAERNAPIYQPPKQVAPPAAVQALLQNPDLRGHFVEKYGYLPPDLRQ